MSDRSSLAMHSPWCVIPPAACAAFLARVCASANHQRHRLPISQATALPPPNDKRLKGNVMKRFLALAAVAAIAFTAAQAGAAEIEIQMLNKGEKGAMVFQPDFVRAAPGDTIKFIPVDKGHDAQSIDGMIPEGATPFKGKMNEEVSVVVEKEGVYGVKCAPHYGMGMVALIVVGEPVNLDQAKAVKQAGKAKKVFAELFEQAGEQAAALH